MLDFRDDYSIGAHPDVLAAIARANETALPGYGQDPVSEAARDLIRAQIGRNAGHSFCRQRDFGQSDHDCGGPAPV